MWIEKTIVIGIVALAAAWSVRFFARAWSGRSKCGCGSGRCPAAKEAADRILRSIETNVADRPGAGPGNGGDPEVRHAAQ